MALRLKALERGDGPPLVILHGLFGAAMNWSATAQRLAARHRVICFDLRNHGGSPWADTMDYGAMAEDVRDTLAEMGVARTPLIGHSMGGKVAMSLAFQSPDLIERLAMVDVAPMAYPPVLRAYAQAMLDIDATTLTRRAEADEALARKIPEPAIRGFLLQNLVAEGTAFRWRLNLPVLVREMTGISGFPPPAPDTRYMGPTTFIRGGNSDYVPEAAEAPIRHLFPAVRFVTIAGAGHWVHVEKPAEFLAAVIGFLEVECPLE